MQPHPPTSLMIVDDDEIDRYLLIRKLKELGDPFSIIEKENGQEALDFFKDCESGSIEPPEGYPPQIVFLDINMPLLNGWEFLELFSDLHDKVQLENSIVIMFTSSNTSADKERIHQFDFVKGYLLKGEFDASDLKQIIESTVK